MHLRIKVVPRVSKKLIKFKKKVLVLIQFSKDPKSSSNEEVKYKSKNTKLDEENENLKSSSDLLKANKRCSYIF